MPLPYQPDVRHDPSQLTELEGNLVMKQLATHRPLTFVLLLTMLTLVPALAVFLLAPILAPNVSEEFQRTVVTALQALIAASLLTGMGWWTEAGFTWPTHGRVLRVLWLPTLIALLPVVFGMAVPPMVTLVVMVAGQLVNAFAEEALFRGLAVRALLPTGWRRTAIITGALFGSLHLIRLLFGAALPETLVQVLFATLFGVGYAAIRIRTGTVWPLIVLHALTNLVLTLVTGDTLPVWFAIAFMIGTNVLLAGYGLYLLRGEREARRLQPTSSSIALEAE